MAPRMQVEHDKNYVKTAADVAVDIHTHKPPGDILVFLSGQAEVEQAVRLIDKQVCRSASSYAIAS